MPIGYRQNKGVVVQNRLLCKMSWDASQRPKCGVEVLQHFAQDT